MFTPVQTFVHTPQFKIHRNKTASQHHNLHVLYMLVVLPTLFNIYIIDVLVFSVVTAGSQIIRTCSENLNIRMNYGLVCMHESMSAPFPGQLCFCHQDRCNRSSTTPSSPRYLLVLLAALLLTLKETMR